MVQFVAIFVHGFQLVFYKDCNFPWKFGLYISSHALLFFALFSQFYVKNYFDKTNKKAVVKDAGTNFKEDKDVHMKTA